MLIVGKIYKEKTTGKIWKCYAVGYTTGSLGYFKSRDGKTSVFFTRELSLTRGELYDLLVTANLSRLSTALGKHRSYLNKLIQVGCSDKTHNKIKDKLTIDWNSDKPLYVNDGVHVPFTIKPISCVLPKHKEWLQSLMMKGCVKL